MPGNGPEEVTPGVSQADLDAFWLGVRARLSEQGMTPDMRYLWVAPVGPVSRWQRLRDRLRFKPRWPGDVRWWRRQWFTPARFRPGVWHEIGFTTDVPDTFTREGH